MMADEETQHAHKSMTEKIAWAKRSFARMQTVKNSDPVAVQDHFLSLAHAMHVVWFRKYVPKSMEMALAEAAAQKVMLRMYGETSVDEAST